MAAVSARRSQRETKKSEQRILEASQNLGLLDERVTIYNQIKCIIESEKDFKCALDRLLDIDTNNTKSHSLDKGFIQKKFELLFNDMIFAEYEKCMALISSTRSLNHDLNIYLQQMIEHNVEVYEKIKDYNIKICMDQISDEEQKEFKGFCNNSQIHYSISGNIEDYKWYNFYELIIEINKNNEIISNREKELYNSIDVFIKDRII